MVDKKTIVLLPTGVIVVCDHLFFSLCLHRHINHTGTPNHIGESAVTVFLDQNRFFSDVSAALMRLDLVLCRLSSRMSHCVALGFRITGNSSISPSTGHQV